jgi:S1-C subfamily serine protease
MVPAAQCRCRSGGGLCHFSSFSGGRAHHAGHDSYSQRIDRHERVISYADAVRSAAPAVVSIYADKLITEQTLIRVPSNSTVQRFSGLGLRPAAYPS